MILLGHISEKVGCNTSAWTHLAEFLYHAGRMRVFRPFRQSLPMRYDALPR